MSHWIGGKGCRCPSPHKAAAGRHLANECRGCCSFSPPPFLGKAVPSSELHPMGGCMTSGHLLGEAQAKCFPNVTLPAFTSKAGFRLEVAPNGWLHDHPLGEAPSEVLHDWLLAAWESPAAPITSDCPWLSRMAEGQPDQVRLEVVGVTWGGAGRGNSFCLLRRGQLPITSGGWSSVLPSPHEPNDQNVAGPYL